MKLMLHSTVAFELNKDGEIEIDFAELKVLDEEGNETTGGAHAIELANKVIVKIKRANCC